MKLNERLKLARTQKGFTQQEVADILHISRATVSSWEVGRTLPSLDFILDLSNLYDLSLDILLKEDMTMVNQVNKELKSKKRYKIISISVGSLVGIFILINLIWLFSLKNQYSYLEKKWDTGSEEFSYKYWHAIEDNYVYEDKDKKIKMMAPKLDMKHSIFNKYLKKEPIFVIGFLDDNTENFLSISFRDNKAYASVPTSSVNNLQSDVRIDDTIYFIPDDPDNPDIFSMPYSGAYPENIERINLFLEANRDKLKSLYDETEKQYNLINKISN